MSGHKLNMRRQHGRELSDDCALDGTDVGDDRA